MMTKSERKKQQLQRQYDALYELALKCQVSKPDGKKIYASLVKIEKEAHAGAEDYSNGKISHTEWANTCDVCSEDTQNLFNRQLLGFFVNGDPRGYSLNINDSSMREQYSQIDIQKDFGGYGILAPEITGN